MQITEFAGREWRRDLPDPRDYSLQHDRVMSMLRFAELTDWPAAADNCEFFPGPVSSRNQVGSVARACIDIVEYYERRVYGRVEPLSSSFLQYAASRMLGNSSDTGALDFRTTLKALTRFGLPPDKLWPNANVEDEAGSPDAFIYSSARQFEDIVYVRLDLPEVSSDAVLHQLRCLTARGIPILFGIAVPSSVSAEPDIEYRPTIDSFPCGHAMVAVGYDDHRRHASKGAIRVRAQWGHSWGEQGHGWIPYSYVTNHLAADFWAILQPRWLATLKEDGILS